jgi:hypothetical protein
LMAGFVLHIEIESRESQIFRKTMQRFRGRQYLVPTKKIAPKYPPQELAFIVRRWMQRIRNPQFLLGICALIRMFLDVLKEVSEGLTSKSKYK